jgi:putative acetyltransferase
MTPDIVIRDETPADIDAIAEVTTVAFKTLEISNHTEQFIVAALRAAGALAFDGRMPQGSVAFHAAFMADA